MLNCILPPLKTNAICQISLFLTTGKKKRKYEKINKKSEKLLYQAQKQLVRRKPQYRLFLLWSEDGVINNTMLQVDRSKFTDGKVQKFTAKFEKQYNQSHQS